MEEELGEPEEPGLPLAVLEPERLAEGELLAHTVPEELPQLLRLAVLLPLGEALWEKEPEALRLRLGEPRELLLWELLML